MATIVDAFGRGWNTSIFRGFEMHDQGWIYTYNRYLVAGVIAKPQGKVRLVYVDTPEEFKHIMSVIENAEGNVDLIDELEAFRKLKNKKEKQNGV